MFADWVTLVTPRMVQLATKVMANDDKNLAYDITLTIHAKKD